MTRLSDDNSLLDYMQVDRSHWRTRFAKYRALEAKSIINEWTTGARNGRICLREDTCKPRRYKPDQQFVIEVHGERAGIRTRDPLIKSLNAYIF